jgi:hypothetical protein
MFDSLVTTSESNITVVGLNTATGYEVLPATVDVANDTVTIERVVDGPMTGLDAGVVEPLPGESGSNDSASGSGAAISVQSAPPSYPTETPSFTFDGPRKSLSNGDRATLDGHEWKCHNWGRHRGRYFQSPVKGTCEFGGGTAYVREETNRNRFLVHNLTLPSVSAGQELILRSTLTAHIAES